MLLTDLADAARKSGLKVVELPGWKTNYSAGGFDPLGILNHHTGSYDSLTDADNDLDYAKWMAFTGRPDLDPPLCNLSLSAECVVYVCASGNANHAGEAKASGPMPAASDGNAIYIGVEAMNSGSQGWDSEGEDADGNPVTQGEALARLNAALCDHYRERFAGGFTADHCRGHKETSVTGKWDPGLLDMDSFRHQIDTILEEDPMADYAAQLDRIETKVDAAADRDEKFRASAKVRHQRILDELEQLAGDQELDAKQIKTRIRRLREQVATEDPVQP